MTRRTVAGLLVAGALVTGGGAVAATSTPAQQGTDTQAFRLLDGLAYKACSLSPTCRNV